jgi:hypothetical protein
MLVRARPSADRAAFDAAIADVAGDVAGTLPGLVRATVSRPRSDQYTDAVPLFDAVLEFAWGSRADLDAATGSASFRQDDLTVLERLVDRGGSSAAWTYEERWIWP